MGDHLELAVAATMLQCNNTLFPPQGVMQPVATGRVLAHCPVPLSAKLLTCKAEHALHLHLLMKGFVFALRERWRRPCAPPEAYPC